jgi:hypothetical protein
MRPAFPKARAATLPGGGTAEFPPSTATGYLKPAANAGLGNIFQPDDAPSHAPSRLLGCLYQKRNSHPMRKYNTVCLIIKVHLLFFCDFFHRKAVRGLHSAKDD